MTLQAYLKICGECGFHVNKGIFYNAVSGYHCSCGFSPMFNKVYLYTNRGTIETTQEERLRAHLTDTMLALKERKLGKKLGEIEGDFD